MKIVKYALISLIIIGLGVLLYFKFKEIKTLKEEIQVKENNIQMLNNTIAELNETIDRENATVAVYQTLDYDIRAGATLKKSMLKLVDVANKNYLDFFIKEDELEQYLGMVFKTAIPKNTVIVKQMFRNPDPYNQELYPLDLVPPYIPIGLQEGDLVDVKFSIPTGDIFTVYSHKEVKSIINDVVTLHISETEAVLMQQVYKDMADYGDVGARWYLIKYVDDNEDILPFYPISNSLNAYVDLNPNIYDTSRLLMPKVREYLEYRLEILRADQNEEKNNQNARIQSITRDSSIQKAYEDDLKARTGEVEETKQSTENSQPSSTGSSGFFDLNTAE